MKANKIKDVMKHVFKLSNIIRYARINLFHKQTVAEHSFNVAVILLAILSDSRVLSYEEKFKVLAAGLLHDVEESLTGDIIATTKRHLSNIEAVEAQAAFDILPFSLMRHWNGSRGLYKDIVKLADVFERQLFCEEEISMGNLEKDLIVIKTHAEEEIKRLEGRMEE